MSDEAADAPVEDPLTHSTIGANCGRCGEWISVVDADALNDAMHEHLRDSHNVTV